MTGANHLFVPHSFTISGFSTLSTGGASQQVATADLTDSLVDQFEREAQKDPFQERLELGFGVPAGLFATIVEVSAFVGDRRPDYAAWFSYLICSTDQMTDRQAYSLLERLKAFAQQDGLEREWKRANSLRAAFERTFYRATPTNLSRLAFRARNKVDSFRVSAHRYGNLTISGACHAVDDVLADGYDQILDGTSSRAGVWNAARTRAIEV